MKEIAELKKTKEDLEIAQEQAYSSIADQNDMVKEMVLKESRQMSEMHQQNQQVLTLKKIIMDNRKVQKKNEKETQDLRDQLQAMQERMAVFGIEDAHHKEENDKELAEAIKILEQATAAHDTHQPTTAPLPAPTSAPLATPPPPSPTPKAAPSPSERASEHDEDDNTDWYLKLFDVKCLFWIPRSN